MSSLILLVEPSRTQAAQVRTLLADAGYDVEVAGSAAAASEQLQARAVDAVILNQSLPDEAGSALCRSIKSQNRQTPVILIAESGRPDRVLEALSTGADDFLIKSSRVSELAQRVDRLLRHPDDDETTITDTVEFDGREYRLSLTTQQWLSLLVGLLDDVAELTERCRGLAYELSKQSSADDRQQPGKVAGVGIAPRTPEHSPAAPDSPEPQSRPRTILLAEDSPTNQILGRSLLEKAGYKVLVADDGREALQTLNSPAGADIELVLMDVEMPEMDGLEATRHIRRQEEATGQHILIVAMTAHSSPEEQQACLDAGMDACQPKPLKPDQLKQTLQNCRRADRTTHDGSGSAVD